MPVAPPTTKPTRTTGTAAKLPAGRPRVPEYWEQTSQQARGIYQTGQVGGGQDIDLTAIAEKQTAQQKKGEAEIKAYFESAKAEREKIRSEVMMERTEMLGAVAEQFATVRRDVDVLIQGRVAEERTMTTDAMRGYLESMASLGHPVSPGTQLQMSRKLAAGSAARISQFAAQQRQTAQSREVELLKMRDQIYQATQRETPSDLEMMQTAQLMGQSYGATSGRTTMGGRGRRRVGGRQRRRSDVLSGRNTVREDFMAAREASGYAGPGATPGYSPGGGTPSPYTYEDEFRHDPYAEPRFTVYPGGGY